MAGRGRRHRFLLLVIAAFAVAGCSSPIGSIGRSVAGPAPVEGIKAVPQHSTSYDFEEVFQRNSDHLLVFTTVDGDRKDPVSPTLCDVFVIEDPGKPTEKKNSVGEEGYTLIKPGNNLIRVEYRGFHDEYTIVVKDPDAGGTGVTVKTDWA